MKIYASVLDKFDLNRKNLALCYANVVDSRTLGQWGDNRDNTKSNFPAIGNYAFSTAFFVSHDMALSTPIKDLKKK